METAGVGWLSGDSMTKLCIQINEMVHTQRCEPCGREHLRTAGPALYLAGTGGPVCPTCGRDRALDLVALLDLSTASDERTAGINWADAGSAVAE